MDLYNPTQIICRVCLTEMGEFQTVFTSVQLEDSQSTMHLSEMICSFSGVQMTLGDGLPEHICLSCAEETVKTYFFKLRCEESDRLLRKRILGSLDTKDSVKNILENATIKNESTDNLNVVSNAGTIDNTLQEHIILDDFEKSFESFNYADEATEEATDDEVNFYGPEKPPIEKVKEYECNICHKMFSRQDLLLRHKIAHAMKMKDFKDENEDTEDNESENSEEIKSSNIQIDGTFAMDETSNTIILKADDCLQLSTCILCFHVFVSDQLLDQHFLEEHLKYNKDGDEEHLVCILCEKRIKDVTFFKKHIKNHHNKKRSSEGKYSCSYCLMKYTKEGHLKNHLKFHQPHQKSKGITESGNYPCKHCDTMFSTKVGLHSHLRKIRILDKKIGSRKKPHVCEICLKAFNQISNLKDHLRTHNGEKPFLCPTCGKGFNQLGNLRQHQVRHSGVKSHICSTCSSGFASKGELHAHLRKHTGVKPFVCDICGNSFTTSSSLTKHKRIHSGEKPYECDYCKMKFSRSGILSRHRRIHTGEKPYVCKICKKAFTQSNDLNSHLRIHTGEKPYICDQCGQSFRQSSALRTHKKTHMGHNLGRSQYRAHMVKKEDKVFVEDQEQILIVP